MNGPSDGANAFLEGAALMEDNAEPELPTEGMDTDNDWQQGADNFLAFTDPEAAEKKVADADQSPLAQYGRMVSGIAKTGVAGVVETAAMIPLGVGALGAAGLGYDPNEFLDTTGGWLQDNVTSTILETGPGADEGAWAYDRFGEMMHWLIQKGGDAAEFVTRPHRELLAHSGLGDPIVMEAAVRAAGDGSLAAAMTVLPFVPKAIRARRNKKGGPFTKKDYDVALGEGLAFAEAGFWPHAFDPNAPRLGALGKESMSRGENPRNPKLLEDKRVPPERVREREVEGTLEGEYLPADPSAVIQPMSPEGFAILTESQGYSKHAGPEGQAAMYSHHVEIVNELSQNLVTRRSALVEALGAENIDMTVVRSVLRDEVAIAVRATMTDVAAFQADGLSLQGAIAKVAGYARLRASALASHGATLAQTFQRMEGLPSVQQLLKSMEEGPRTNLIKLLERMGQDVRAADGRVAALEASMLKTPDLGGLPSGKTGMAAFADYTPVDTFSWKQKVALKHEVHGALRAYVVEGLGMVVERIGLAKGHAQIVKRWGKQYLDKVKEGVMTPSGHFLTPGEFKALIQLTQKVTETERPLTIENMASMDKFLKEVAPAASGAHAYRSARTLKDIGVVDRYQRTNQRVRRTGAEYAAKKKDFDARQAIMEQAVQASIAERKPLIGNEPTAKTMTLQEMLADRVNPAYSAKPAKAASKKKRGTVRNRKGKKPLNVGKGKYQRGAADMNGAMLHLVDKVARAWAARADKGKVKYKDKPEGNVSSARGGLGVAAEGIEFFGGQVFKHMLRRVKLHQEKGKYAAGELAEMIDQVPQPYWTEAATPHMVSFFNMRLQRMGHWISKSTGNESLFAIVRNHGPKLLTAPRRVMGAIPKVKEIPGALTMGRISHKANDVLLHDLASGRPPKTQFGKDLRDLMTRAFQWSKDKGVTDAPFIRDYYPLAFNLVAKARRGAFDAMLGRNGIEAAQRASIIQQIIGEGGMIRVKAGPINKDAFHQRTVQNLEKSRQVFDKIPMSELKPFLQTDVINTMHQYLKDLVERTTTVERFGKQDALFEAKLAEVMKEGEEIGHPMLPREVEKLYDMRRIQSHTYSSMVPLHAAVIRTGNALQSWSKLGNVVMGTISEWGVPLLNETIGPHYVKHVIPSVLNSTFRGTMRAVWRDVQPSRWQTMAEGVSKAVDVMAHDLLTATYAGDVGGVFSNLAFVANGLHAVTNGLIVANTTAFEMGLRAVTNKEMNIRTRRGKTSDFHKADMQMYKYYGIEADQMIRWQKDGRPMEGAFYTQYYEPALLKYLNENVFHPRGTNQPAIHSNKWFAPVRTLTSYVTVLGNTFTPALINGIRGKVLDGAPHTPMVKGRKMAAAWGTMATVYGLAVLSEYLRDLHNYGGTDKHPMMVGKTDDEIVATMAARGVNRAGFLGFFGVKILDILELAQYQKPDGGDMLESAAGPIYGDVAELGAIVVGVMAGANETKDIAKFMADMTPQVTMLPAQKGDLSRREYKEALEKWLISIGLPPPRKKKSSYWLGGSKGGGLGYKSKY